MKRARFWMSTSRLPGTRQTCSTSSVSLACFSPCGLSTNCDCGRWLRSIKAAWKSALRERQRIAQDLHDTLLQSVQGVILKFYALTMRLPPGSATRQEMEKALKRAGEVVEEGRDRIHNLRVTAASRDNLPAALQWVAEEISTGNEICFKMIVEGVALELDPIVLDETYYIGREALINAFRHSDGLHIEVQITYHPRQLRLRVRDDGRGIDPAILEKQGRENHWGLPGMRERAQRIGAEVKLSSHCGEGTEVELTVPGATAYRAWRLWKYFRRTELVSYLGPGEQEGDAAMTS